MRGGQGQSPVSPQLLGSLFPHFAYEEPMNSFTTGTQTRQPVQPNIASDRETLHKLIDDWPESTFQVVQRFVQTFQRKPSRVDQPKPHQANQPKFLPSSEVIEQILKHSKKDLWRGCANFSNRASRGEALQRMKPFSLMVAADRPYIFGQKRAYSASVTAALASRYLKLSTS